MNPILRRMHPLKDVFSCRLCSKVALAALVSIFTVELVILIPSYGNYQRDLLKRIEEVGFATIWSAFRLHGHVDNRDLLIYGQALARGSAVSGGAIYQPDGQPVGTFGETPELTPKGIREGAPTRVLTADGNRYEVAWMAADTGLPLTVIGRLNSTWVGPELTAFVWRIFGLVLLISLVVCGVIMLIVSRFVLRPMLDLRRNLVAARDDPANADQYVLDTTSRDEFGEMVDAANGLLHRVSKTHREELAAMAAMVDHATDAILAYDDAKNIVYANSACLRLCGCETAASLQASALPLLSFDTTHDWVSLTDSLAQGPYSKEATLLVNDGRIVPCFVSAAMLDDKRGRLMRFYAVICDVSEMKAAREKLERRNFELAAANSAKSEFLANMSHELRTPLNAVIGFSQLIYDQAYGPVGIAKYVEYAKDINDSGNHLLCLINDILDLSKIEAGMLELDEEIVDVAQIIRSAHVLLKERAEAGGVVLKHEIPADLPALRADERKLKQILLNLLSNAVKFTPAGGHVELRAATDAEGGFSISVADDGIGIAPEDMAKAMAPFGQVDSTLSRKYDGTGLGLPLTLALVELHGGDLTLESVAGSGTRATVRFPAERVVAPNRAVERVGAAWGRSPPSSVLECAAVRAPRLIRRSRACPRSGLPGPGG